VDSTTVRSHSIQQLASSAHATGRRGRYARIELVIDQVRGSARVGTGDAPGTHAFVLLQ